MLILTSADCSTCNGGYYYRTMGLVQASLHTFVSARVIRLTILILMNQGNKLILTKYLLLTCFSFGTTWNWEDVALITATSIACRKNDSIICNVHTSQHGGVTDWRYAECPLTRVSPLATADDASFIFSVALDPSLRAPCLTESVVDK